MDQSSPKPGRTETFISLSVMGLLVAIAAGVLWRQADFNPAVLVFEPHNQGRELPVVAAGSKASVPDLVALPDDIGSMGPPETFGPDRLADKINGKAPLYLSAGFKKLSSQRFVLKERAGQWFELNVYRLGNPKGAFAVFSVQRRSDARTAGITRHSYGTGNALFVVHGPFYLELIGSRATDALRDAMTRVAQEFVRRHWVETESEDPGDLFPTQGLDRGSITLLAEDAFGFAGLDQVTTAIYNLDGNEVMAFASRRKSPEAARELAGAYRIFLKRFGGQDVSGEKEVVSGGRLVRIMDAYELIFARGPYLAGVHEASDVASALELGHRLAAAIQEKEADP